MVVKANHASSNLGQTFIKIDHVCSCVHFWAKYKAVTFCDTETIYLFYNYFWKVNTVDKFYDYLSFVFKTKFEFGEFEVSKRLLIIYNIETHPEIVLSSSFSIINTISCLQGITAIYATSLH